MNCHAAHVQKAFALAHRASEDPAQPAEARAIFRAIAHELWRACGVEPALVIVPAPKEIVQ